MPKAPKPPTAWLAQDVRLWPIAKLRASEYNAKVHPPEQVAQLARLIARFGFTVPIVARPDGEIVAGHARLEAARALQLAKVPVVVVAHLNEEEARALRAADNRVAELSSWDPVSLSRELAALETLGEDLNLLGWNQSEFDKLVDDANAASRSLDPAPAQSAATSSEPTAASDGSPSDEPVDEGAAPRWIALLRGGACLRSGELWTVGPHRLLIGDARDPKAVTRVMEGEPVKLVVVDPPYCSGGYQEAGKAAGTWGKIASDNLSTRGWQALMSAWITAAQPGTVYVFTDWRMWTNLLDQLESAGLALRSMIVWNKRHPGQGALWRTQHELVAYASREGSRRKKGAPSFGNVIDAPRTGNRNHYTEKPVELLARLLEGDAASGRTGAVLDTFAGSCSTLVACNKVGRPGRGIEIEPVFAQVGLRRLEEETGEKARLDGDGRTLDDVAEERASGGKKEETPVRASARRRHG